MTVADIDSYVSGLAPAGAEAVAELRRRVHDLRGDVTEVIRYDIPTFQVDGHSRVHIAAWAKHVSIYPDPGLPEAAPYSSGKGTLKFSLSEPIPWAVVDDVLRELLR